MSERVEFLIIDVIAKPSIAFGVAMLLTSALRRHSASLRHRVWVVGIFVALSLPLLTLLLPRLPLRVLAADTTENGRHAPFIATNGRNASGVAVDSRLGPAGDVPRIGRRTGDATSTDWIRRFAIVWLTGAALLTIRLGAAYRRAHRIVDESVASERLQRRRLGPLRTSRRVATPIVVGIARPTIILPKDADVWSDDDLDTVLTHELAHIARRDTTYALVAQIACIVYWWNPLAWIAAAGLTREAERACDDRVVTAGGDVTRYAHLILTLASATRRASLSMAAMAMAQPSEVETRLLAILDPSIRRDMPSRRLMALLACIATVLATTGAALRLEAAPSQAREQVTPGAPTRSEPDQRGDSLASPSSERVVTVPSDARVRSALAAALAGPDSVLASILRSGLAHRPTTSADLVSARSAWALAQERNGELVRPLVDSLASRDWRVQAYATWALANARTNFVDERLVPLLDHDVWRVRAMAAASLRGTRNTKARQAFERGLRDDAWQVRAAAVDHFAALGDPALLERLRPLSTDRHIAVRRAVADALAGR